MFNGTTKNLTHFFRNAAISAANRLLLTLRFYATGNMLLTVADFVGVSKSSASLIVKQVSVAIARLCPRYCKMPEGDARRQAQQEFYSIARFPFVIGAIDCTHVRIQSPGIKNNIIITFAAAVLRFEIGGIRDLYVLYRNKAVKLLEIIIINYIKILLVF